MLPRADSTVTPVARADPIGRLAPVADPRQEAFTRSLAGELGKSMQGQVVSKLPDGSFLVKVAGTSARMLLPPSAQVGQQMPLTLIALSPRPTFEIATQQGTQVSIAYSEAAPALPPGQSAADSSGRARAAPLVYVDGGSTPGGTDAAAAQGQAAETPLSKPLSYAAAMLAKTPLTPSERLTAIDPKSTPATLSDTGRHIASVLGAAAAAAPGSLVAATPLIPTPAAPPQQMAAALQQSLSESGLFYESHVAEWSNGERPLETLAREPQMGRTPASAIDQESARMINFQLNTQEQGRVAWEGQPWPGQPMRWEVARDAPEGQQPGGQESDPPWRSGVRMRFPLLGEINASVVLHGGQLHIQVDTGSGATGQLLREHADRLTGAMEAAGLPLSSLNIRASASNGASNEEASNE